MGDDGGASSGNTGGGPSHAGNWTAVLAERLKFLNEFLEASSIFDYTRTDVPDYRKQSIADCLRSKLADGKDPHEEIRRLRGAAFEYKNQIQTLRTKGYDMKLFTDLIRLIALIRTRMTDVKKALIECYKLESEISKLAETVTKLFIASSGSKDSASK